MNDTIIEEAPATFTMMERRQFWQILLLGAISGLLVWGLSFLLDTYVYQAILCQNGASDCGASDQYSMITASIVAGVLALLALVRLGVFRPLLVVLAVVVSLWSLVETLWTAQWYYAAICSVVLYALAYGAYGWIARIRSFWIALGISIVLMVAVRFVITS